MGKHPIAFWSGIAAFFSSLLAIGAIDILNPNSLVKLSSSVFVGIITAAAIYARERLHDVRDLQQRRFDGQMVVEQQGDKKVYSLELADEPESLEKQNFVTFRVKRR